MSLFSATIQAAPNPVWPATTKDDAEQALRPSLQKLKRCGPFRRPVCLFFFAMKNDGAWYTWVAEPIEAEGGNPVLRSPDAPDCRPLDKQSLKEMIERVDAWHAAIFRRLTANGPARSKATRKRAKP